jgi:hypothetical protein
MKEEHTTIEPRSVEEVLESVTKLFKSASKEFSPSQMATIRTILAINAELQEQSESIVKTLTES